jgi:glycosyltransferase involved in cell wall biosynthesis
MDRRFLVSVVTPSFNYGRYIGQCLESVRRQTHPAIEHLVLDACSTDETREVVRAFEGRYGMRAVFAKDGGQADALNRGFAQAKGEVLCWLNADDYWLSETVVEEAVRALDGGADVATGGGWYVDPAGREFRRIRARTEKQIARDLRFYDVILQPATFWRRRVHRPLREEFRYSFDWTLFLEMQRGGARFASAQRDWAAYRWHAEGKTASDPAGRRGETAEILKEQFGERSPQHRWARAVYAAYLAAERRRSPVLARAIKRATYWANAAVAVATRNRICSW